MMHHHLPSMQLRKHEVQLLRGPAAQALSQALADFPDVNATLQSDMRAIVRHRHHNIGVAIATPTGLVVRPLALHPLLSITPICLPSSEPCGPAPSPASACIRDVLPMPRTLCMYGRPCSVVKQHLQESTPRG